MEEKAKLQINNSQRLNTNNWEVDTNATEEQISPVEGTALLITDTVDFKEEQTSPLEGSALLISDTGDTKEEQISPVEGSALLITDTMETDEEAIRTIEVSTLLTQDTIIQETRQKSKVDKEGCLPAESDANTGQINHGINPGLTFTDLVAKMSEKAWANTTSRLRWTQYCLPALPL